MERNAVDMSAVRAAKAGMRKAVRHRLSTLSEEDIGVQCL